MQGLRLHPTAPLLRLHCVSHSPSDNTTFVVPHLLPICSLQNFLFISEHPPTPSVLYTTPPETANSSVYYPPPHPVTPQSSSLSVRLQVRDIVLIPVLLLLVHIVLLVLILVLLVLLIGRADRFEELHLPAAGPDAVERDTKLGLLLAQQLL